jgi:hypothetical protein
VPREELARALNVIFGVVWSPLSGADSARGD